MGRINLNCKIADGLVVKIKLNYKISDSKMDTINLNCKIADGLVGKINLNCKIADDRMGTINLNCKIADDLVGKIRKYEMGMICWATKIKPNLRYNHSDPVKPKV